MKKLIAASAAAVLFLSAASCTEEVQTPELKLESEKDCIIKYGGNEYDCSLSFLSDGVEAVTLNSPDSLAGLSFRYTDGKYTVAYGSLICRSDSVLLPDNSFPTAVSKVMHSLRKEKENIVLSPIEKGYTYSGKAGIPYTLKTDENASITEISFGKE